MISSENRDRCIMRMDRAEVNSMAKSRSETESRELSVGLAKPRARAVWKPVHRVGGGGQGPSPQGTLVHPLQTVLQPGDIPPEHVGVGHHIVSKGGGLGPLEVGMSPA